MENWFGYIRERKLWFFLGFIILFTIWSVHNLNSGRSKLIRDSDDDYEYKKKKSSDRKFKNQNDEEYRDAGSLSYETMYSGEESGEYRQGSRESEEVRQGSGSYEEVLSASGEPEENMKGSQESGEIVRKQGESEADFEERLFEKAGYSVEEDNYELMEFTSTTTEEVDVKLVSEDEKKTDEDDEKTDENDEKKPDEAQDRNEKLDNKNVKETPDEAEDEGIKYEEPAEKVIQGPACDPSTCFLPDCYCSENGTQVPPESKSLSISEEIMEEMKEEEIESEKKVDEKSEPVVATPCDKTCRLPNCFCSEDGTAVPGGFEPEDVPMMILLTFDDEFPPEILKIFNGERKNPNGCNIKATFFPSHITANYSLLNDLYRLGHEVAVHSLTNSERHNYWEFLDKDGWEREMVQARDLLNKYANIPDDIVGVRAPALITGGDDQYKMMEEQEFLYDSSIVAGIHNPPYWPYTLQHQMPHKCAKTRKCPKNSHNVWEMVMNLMDNGCLMNCKDLKTGKDVSDLLNRNFNRHYNSNRAPMGIFRKWSWFLENPEFYNAFVEWVDNILSKYDDVFFVTMTQAIQWMKNPRSTDEMVEDQDWQQFCSINPKRLKPACRKVNKCRLEAKNFPTEEFILETCETCPKFFPWLNDPKGD